MQDRAAKRLRAKPQPFSVVSNQTVRVDMEIDTGVRWGNPISTAISARDFGLELILPPGNV